MCFEKTKIKHCRELSLHSCADTFFFLSGFVSFGNLEFLTLCLKMSQVKMQLEIEKMVIIRVLLTGTYITGSARG